MEGVSEKVSRLISIICCPLCRAELGREGNTLLCRAGHGPFRMERECIFLIESRAGAEYKEAHESGVNRLKSFFKRFPRLYYLLWYIFCPVWLSGPGPRLVLQFLKSDSLVLDLGSGPRRIDKSFINVDVAPFAEVDVVADALHLPFCDASCDAVVNESLLEHVPDPTRVAREIARVVKPGGMVYISVPFLTPFHASPDDFTRWTKSGIRSLFADFETVQEGIDAGLWSAFLVLLAYSLGVLFSFGSRRLAPFIGLFFMMLLGPFKVFDYIFARIPGADAVAAQLYFLGRKR